MISDADGKQNGTYTGDRIVVANFFLKKFVTNFPGKNGWTFVFESSDVLHHAMGGNPWLGSTDRFRSNRSRFIETTQNFAYTTVAYLKQKLYYYYLHLISLPWFLIKI